MPTLPSIPPLGLTGGEETLVQLLPQLWAARFQPCPCPGSSEEGTSLAVASLALLVQLNLLTIRAQSHPKGSFAPAVAAQAGGAGWRSKALPFSQAQALASPRLGPSAIVGAVKTGLPLARASGPELRLCSSRAAAAAEGESGSRRPGCFHQAAWVRPCAGAGAGSRAQGWRSGALGSLLRAAVGSLLLVQPGVSAACGARWR